MIFLHDCLDAGQQSQATQKPLPNKFFIPGRFPESWKLKQRTHLL